MWRLIKENVGSEVEDGVATSLNLRLDKIQEALVLALMIVFSVAVFYSSIGLEYKLIVSVMVFSIVLLVGLANQDISQKEKRQAS